VNHEGAVAIAGRIGGGDTTLASLLADHLKCPRATFGSYARSVALKRGLDPSDRAVLRSRGEELIGEGWHSFCRAVLNYSGYVSCAAVVDAIRHVAAIQPSAGLSLLPYTDLSRSTFAGKAVLSDCLFGSDSGGRASGARTGEVEVRQMIEPAEFIVDHGDPRLLASC
jgi:hypothetical protein